MGSDMVSVCEEDCSSGSFLGVEVWDALVWSKSGRKAKRLGGGRLLGMGGRGAVLVRAGGNGGGGIVILWGLSSEGAGGGDGTGTV